MNDVVTSLGSASSRVFVYGTLRVPAVLARVLGRVPRLVDAHLHDYRRGRVAGASYPAVVAAPGAGVDGAVLLDVREREWRLLDDYEGELYDRIGVTLTLAQPNTSRTLQREAGQPAAHQPAAHQPAAHQPEAHQPEAHQPEAQCLHVEARGLALQAQCYVLAPSCMELFDPTPWSLETFVEHDLPAFLRDLG